MRSSRTLRRVAFAAILTAGFLFQGTWALAATTGGLTGVVHDDTGAPVAAATVTASSPSQTETTQTDAQGHYVFLVLAPDTYTLTVARNGYQTTSVAGNTVFADQTQQVLLTVPRNLAVIAHGQTTATNLVKPGVGGDLYNVTPAVQQAAAALGGGGNLASIYSAIAAVPGLVVGTGGMGWNQAVVIHGQNPFTTGFEYDGIPVNRAFDNYTSSTGSNLGLQELQVYTGGGPADISSSGISGFINQVIKTGTYPGYGNLSGTDATEGFYHSASFEAGGSTPDRNFSYYVGVSGYDESPHILTNNDSGASLMQPGSYYSDYNPYFLEYTDTGQGVVGLCGPAMIASHTFPESTSYPDYPYPGCDIPFSGLFGGLSYLSDRENVVNLHFGIPRADGQKDDFQLLWTSSAMDTFVNSSPTEAGPGLLWGEDAMGYGDIGAFGSGPVTYMSAYTYNQPFGTTVNNPATGAPTVPIVLYSQPNAPPGSFFGAMPTNTNLDNFHNDVGALKLQWIHPFSDNSYLRVYAYSLFTDWTEDGPTSAATEEYLFTGISPNYNLITHTTGGDLAYENQINDQNLVSFDSNYVQANTSRFNNTGYLAEVSPVGLISKSGSTYTCWGGATMTAVPCASAIDPPGDSYANNAFDSYYLGEPVVTGAAAAAGANWSTLWNGGASGTYNTVTPHFYNLSISDQWRPNDRISVNASLRYSNFEYALPNSAVGQNPFYAQVVQQYACWNPTIGTYTAPLLPGTFPPAPAEYFSGACPSETVGSKTYNFVHPGGTFPNGTVAPNFTDVSPSSYDMDYYQPRISATYQSNPNTVWRFDAGRYAEPPLTAAVQYEYAGGSPQSLWANFMDDGFFSPFHAIPGETSAQYSGSLEHRFTNSDWSFKISPFYSTTSNWEQQSFIGAGFVTQIPVGEAENYGVEFSLSKGDFNRNGFAAMFSFTYTQALVQFQNLLGRSQISQINTSISDYNSLTTSAPCYTPTGSINTPDPVCAPGDVANPYYGKAMQPLLDPTAWYPQGELAMGVGGVNNNPEFYNSPYVSSLILNWRHDKLAITPSLQLESGTPYGGPLDVTGEDPRTCESNQNDSGVVPGSLNCDYTYEDNVGGGPFGYLYIPNPQTGHFANIGEYTEPNIVIGNIQATYDVSPKLRLQLTAADLFHTCFGGSVEPWTTANSPGQYICGYGANSTFYTSNFYNGTGPGDAADNGGVVQPNFEQQSYGPKDNNSQGGFIPFNLYISLQIHL